ncbi:hypothetical protein L218DRAFT_1002921 [Marasmius fiardii PR-910]|nr:hypothetical protein L218DRAFT_1002921 [Marasmius fiardii PR-910]
MVKLDGPTNDAINALPAEHHHFARIYAELHPALSTMMSRPHCVTWRQVMSILDSLFEDLHSAANADEEDNTYPLALLISMDTMLNTVESDNFTLPKNPSWHLLDGTIKFLKEQEGVPDLGKTAYEDKTTQPRSCVASISDGKSTAAASNHEGQNAKDNEDELVDKGQPEDEEEELNQEEVFVPRKACCNEKPGTSTHMTCSQAVPESTIISIPQAKKVKPEGGKPLPTAPKPAPKPVISKVVHRAHSPKDFYGLVTRNELPETLEHAPHAHAEARTALKCPKEPMSTTSSRQIVALLSSRFVNALKARGETVPEESRASLFLPSGLHATIESLANGISMVQRPSRGQLGTCCFTCINDPHKCGFPTGKAHKCPRCKELGMPCSFNVYPKANANMKNWAALVGMSSPLSFQQQLANIFDNHATIGNLIKVQDILESQIESCLSNDQVYMVQLHASGRDACDVFYIMNESNPGLVDDPLFISVLAGIFGWETKGLETGFHVVCNKDGFLCFLDGSGNVTFTDNNLSFPSGAPPINKSSVNPVTGPSYSKDDSKEVSEAAAGIASGSGKTSRMGARATTAVSVQPGLPHWDGDAFVKEVQQSIQECLCTVNLLPGTGQSSLLCVLQKLSRPLVADQVAAHDDILNAFKGAINWLTLQYQGLQAHAVIKSKPYINDDDESDVEIITKSSEKAPEPEAPVSGLKASIHAPNDAADSTAKGKAMAKKASGTRASTAVFILSKAAAKLPSFKKARIEVPMSNTV